MATREDPWLCYRHIRSLHHVQVILFVARLGTLDSGLALACGCNR